MSRGKNDVKVCEDEPCAKDDHAERPFSRDGRLVTVAECPICLVPTESARTVLLEKCGHNICFDCAQTMSENRYKYKWCSICPMCREPWTSNDFDRVYTLNKQQCMRVSVPERLQFMIDKIGQHNSNLALACTIFAHMDNVSNEEKITQVNAVKAFFDGRISFQEMRRLAG